LPDPPQRPPAESPEGLPEDRILFPVREENAIKVQRTKLGVLLLLLGMLLIWAPFISVTGVALTFVGAFLVMMGDEIFGPAHARNGLVAGIILFIGLMGTMAAVRNLREALVQVEPSDQAAVFAGYLALIVVLLVAIGLAHVLITYELQTRAGRRLLWSGLLSWSGYLLLVATQLHTHASAALTATGATPLGLSEQAMPYIALRALPALLFSAAYYVTWSRLKGGDIPVARDHDSEPVEA
jgi:hypothetical protein